MRKINLLLILLIVCSIGWSSDGGWDIGTLFTRTIKYPSKRITADYTATAGDAGKTISIYCPNSVCEVELPTAQVGMEFTFMGESMKGFSIDPADTDIFLGRDPQPDAGDKLTSTDATYNSITIFSTQSNYWNVLPINGTFNDGGQ